MVCPITVLEIPLNFYDFDRGTVMKRFMCLCLIAGILVLSGCNKDGAAVQYTIYYDSAAAAFETELTASNNSGIPFEEASKKDFYYSDKTNADNPSADTQKEIDIGGTTYEVSLKRSFATSLNSSEVSSIRPYGLFDEYESEQAEHLSTKVKARFRQDTEELVFFSAGNVPNTFGYLTEAEAKELADAQLIELYGEETASKYTFTETVLTETEDQKHIGVIYTRYICGYPTTDEIQFMYSMQGELCKIYASKLGIFDPIESSITSEKLQNAEEAFQSALSDSWTVSKTIIALEAEGSCYLMKYAAQKIDGNLIPMVFYINIE